MTVRKKRSISVPADLDAQIEAAAATSSTTYSGWLAAAARKQLLVLEGLQGVAEYERTHGSFSEAELAEAEAWARDAVRRSGRSGTARRRGP